MLLELLENGYSSRVDISGLDVGDELVDVWVEKKARHAPERIKIPVSVSGGGTRELAPNGFDGREVRNHVFQERGNARPNVLAELEMFIWVSDLEYDGVFRNVQTGAYHAGDNMMKTEDDLVLQLIAYNRRGGTTIRQLDEHRKFPARLSDTR